VLSKTEDATLTASSRSWVWLGMASWSASRSAPSSEPAIGVGPVGDGAVGDVAVGVSVVEVGAVGNVAVEDVAVGVASSVQ
jgi:hypothetical protein